MLLAAALLLATAGTISYQAQDRKNDLDALLKKTLKSRFQKKDMKEIYLSGPNRTHNAFGASS